MSLKLLKISLCIPLLLFLCACVDYSELNMQKIVNGATVDKEGEKTEVGIVCAATSEGEKSETIKTSGENFFDAVRNAASVTDKKLWWGHAAVLILGEEALPGTDSILDSILRARDVYPDIALVAAKGRAEDLAKNGEDVMQSIYNMFANEKNSKRFRAIRIWELLRAREEYGVYILPTVSAKDDGIRLSGGAVMREGKLSGYLSGDEMLLISLITDKDAGGYLPKLSAGENSVSFEILAKEVKKKVEKEEILTDVKITLSPAEVEGEITDRLMKSMGEEYLKKSIEELFQRAERERLGDIFSLGKDTDYKKIKVKCDVRISNILGGER